VSVAPRSYQLSLADMVAYSGPGNIHSEESQGDKLRLGGALVQGGQLVSLIEDLLLRHFGPAFLVSGTVDVKFIRPVRPGDILTATAIETQRTAEPAGTIRVGLAVELVNQRGELCTVGTASVRPDCR
jgi:acyl dehydratase